MKSVIALVGLAGMSALCAAKPVSTVPATLAVAQPAPKAPTVNMTLSSPDLKAGGRLPLAQVANGFGCSGGNQSPALQWTNIPAGTKSLVLTMYDPDAPTGSGFWHWNVYNLPPSSTGLAAGMPQLPDGARQLRHDGGAAGYVGACPPAGDKPHRYIFTLYALNDTLDLPEQASPAYLGFNLNGKTLAKTQLTAYYSR